MTDVVLPYDESGQIIDPVAAAHRQVEDACETLEGDATGIIDWPWANLRRLTGPMSPGDVWYFAARSGSGKTTMSTSAVDYWQASGIRIYVLALETRPKSWRTMWACQRLGIHPGDALSGRLKQLAAMGDVGAQNARSQIQLELVRQVEGETANRVIVDEASFVDRRVFERAIRRAKELGCHMVLVDHVDHIEPEDIGNSVAESQYINRRAPKMAQENDIVLLMASQLNQTINAGHGLSGYSPPQVQNLWHPSIKQHSATGIIGLFRPVDPDASKEKVQAARDRDIEPSAVLKPNTMGVTAMKLRNYGSREGDRVELWVQNGKVVQPYAPEGPPPTSSQHYQAAA